MNKPLLEIKNVSKIYSDEVGYKIHLLENISFSLTKGKVTTFLAPKGSGKTSLLNIIAGLEKSTTGSVIKNCNKVAFIPSEPSSFPWLNVEENIKFASKLGNAEIKKIITLVGLEGYEDHFPNNKSEGFRFRIALGRALAYQPEIIVIDEPFNNLNSTTREEIYLMLRDVIEENDVTIVLGSTNISEAIFLSDRIIIMKKKPGEIIDEIEISFTSKRDINTITGNDFINYRNKIEEIFYKKLNKHLYRFSV